MHLSSTLGIVRRRVRAWARRRLRLYDDRRHPLSELAVCSIAWFGGIAALGLVATGATHHLGAVLLMGVLATVGELVTVDVSPTLKITCSDIVLCITLAALSPADAALVMLAASASFAVLGRQSLHETIGRSAFYVSGASVGVLVSSYLRSFGLAEAVLVTVIVLATFVAMRAIELLLFAIVGFVTGNGERFASAWGRVAECAPALPVLFMAEAPVSVLGAIAYRTSPWFLLCVAAPYVVAWSSQRQTARLADAQRRMHRDTLTGLLNRGGFMEAAERELDAASRYGHGVAMVMGDLDNFKRVNDSLGHLVGDDALRRTAAAITAVIGGSRHIAGRYGGEEFVLLMVAASDTDVTDTAERIRASVAESLEPFSSSISLGIAYFGAGDRLESLVDRADKALYSAKFAGKNCVHEWPRSLQRPVRVTPRAA